MVKNSNFSDHFGGLFRKDIKLKYCWLICCFIFLFLCAGCSFRTNPGAGRAATRCRAGSLRIRKTGTGKTGTGKTGWDTDYGDLAKCAGDSHHLK